MKKRYKKTKKEGMSLTLIIFWSFFIFGVIYFIGSIQGGQSFLIPTN
jgi:hypothetical protein